MVGNEEYSRWLKYADDETKRELLSYTPNQIEDAFYRNLEFGTGGLRGVIGAGTNRINKYTVMKASQGLAYYVLDKYCVNASIAIGYDSRNKSDIFAKTAAAVFAANGIKVHIWPRLLPVPTLSYATRYLQCSAGVMITASHNPCQYNGYKVYGEDGCQITIEAAKEILKYIENVDIFNDVRVVDFDEAVNNYQIEYIYQTVLDNYISEVKRQSVLYGDEINKNISIVYSPLNGTGLEPITRILADEGYKNVTVVEEQRFPDGNFPTCPYPNPEIIEALALGIEYCKKVNADLMLATDPDCDRVGIAIKNKNDEYQLLTGNEVGILLLDYICSQKKKHNQLPQNPVFIKTIVTSDLADVIATSYGLSTINVLTGFKFIGEQIGLLEQRLQENRFVFGFEESNGYLAGTYVRDKDAVFASLIICEMYCYYKIHNISLIDKLNELYSKHGYYLNSLRSYEFNGQSGMYQMALIMRKFRDDLFVGLEIAGRKIKSIEDYNLEINDLPKSDVIKYVFDDDSALVVRPSGTEPKLKIYCSIKAANKDTAICKEMRLIEWFRILVR